jgi:DNA-binding response OmpR family regulator
LARIILADDDEIVAEIACSALIDAGHGAGWVADGEAALAAITRRRPDLLILDCNMPKLSGVTLLRQLRNSQEWCDLPVIMLTARTGETDEDLARYAGANDYIRKPFDTALFTARVEAVLNQAKRANQLRTAPGSPP